MTGAWGRSVGENSCPGHCTWGRGGVEGYRYDVRNCKSGHP